jgi:hypothetical protein
MKTKITQTLLSCFCAISLALMCAGATQVNAQQEPGVRLGALTPDKVTAALAPVVTEFGKVSLSVDGLGTLSTTGTMQVNKPSGATVRGAYMAAASTGFSGRVLLNGDVKINGVNVVWTMQTASSISSSNHFSDVTSIVKPIIDAAPAGLVNITITEVNSSGIDGEVLAVIFDDPGQTTNNTVVLLFGAQNIAGDVFAVGLANPLDLTDPSLVLDMSLGISFGAQGCASGQFSQVDVNGTRLTTSAGGEDDGTCANGALLTVGGIGDTNANPPPLTTPSGNPRIDDELYNLKPFVKTGDVLITVNTRNPSNDDNIFFSSFFLSVTGIVGEGIILAPATATNSINTSHTVTATVQDNLGNPVASRLVTFTVVSGPHVGLTGTDLTDVNGKATFTYTGTTVGTDVIIARMVNSSGNIQSSNTVEKRWITTNDCTSSPTCEVKITSPKDSSFVCDDSVKVTATHSISGGTPPFISTCDVNGVPAVVTGNTFMATVPLTPGWNTIIARCTVKDSCGKTTDCRDIVNVFSADDNTPPDCKFDFRGISTAYGNFIDNESGIASITPLYLYNCTLTVDPFTPGDKQVKFRLDNLGLDSYFGFDIKITDQCGNSHICDPVISELSADGANRPYTFKFRSVDRYLILTNHGLSEIQIDLNGNRFALYADPGSGVRMFNAYRIPAEGSISIDLKPYLRDGENIMQVEIAGRAGARADFLLIDEAHEIDHTLELQPVPAEFKLSQNYPNPFNPSTTIRFGIPAQIANGTRVQLRIYNTLGVLVRTLVDEVIFPGEYAIEWNGKNANGEAVASGIYIFQFISGEFRATKRMTMLK